MGRMQCRAAGPPLVCQGGLGGSSPVIHCRHGRAGMAEQHGSRGIAPLPAVSWTADKPVHPYLQGWRALCCKAG